MAKKRYRKVRKKDTGKPVVQEVVEEAPKKRVKRDNAFLEFYDLNYRKLLLIPFILLLLAIGQVAYQTVQTGEFITRGVSLKGGTTVTIPTAEEIDQEEFLARVSANVPEQDLELRILRTTGIQNAIIIESDATDTGATDLLLETLEEQTGLDQDDFSVDVIGSSLGESFFQEIIKALWVAFLAMGMVVFMYFGKDMTPKIITVAFTLVTGFIIYYSNNAFMYIFSLILTGVLIYYYLKHSIPSIAVVLAAFSDMIITVAVVNLIGIKLSTAGVAAFLMLIGYSIDTNILLSTRVLKRKQGTLFDRIIASMKTGLTMSTSTLAAVTVVLILSKSEVLTQIMSILLIGLIVDIFMTWIQNAGILRIYLEKKNG